MFCAEKQLICGGKLAWSQLSSRDLHTFISTMNPVKDMMYAAEQLTVTGSCSDGTCQRIVRVIIYNSSWGRGGGSWDTASSSLRRLWIHAQAWPLWPFNFHPPLPGFSIFGSDYPQEIKVSVNSGKVETRLWHVWPHTVCVCVRAYATNWVLNFTSNLIFCQTKIDPKWKQVLVQTSWKGCLSIKSWFDGWGKGFTCDG